MSCGGTKTAPFGRLRARAPLRLVRPAVVDERAERVAQRRAHEAVTLLPADDARRKVLAYERLVLRARHGAPVDDRAEVAADLARSRVLLDERGRNVQRLEHGRRESPVAPASPAALQPLDRALTAEFGGRHGLAALAALAAEVDLDLECAVRGKV